MIPIRVILALLLAPLAADAQANRAFTLVIPQGVNLQESDILPLLPEHPPAGRTFEIVFYYYSSAVETFSYSESEEMKLVAGTGQLKALVKIMKGGRLRQALFIESTGSGKAEILRNFSMELKKVIGLY